MKIKRKIIMLTSKQRAFLRGIASKRDTLFQIGKGGISNNQIIEIERLLEAHEIVKIHVLENALVEPRAVCDEVVSLIDGCEPVTVIGKRFVIYKQSVENKTIDLLNLRIIPKEDKKDKKGKLAPKEKKTTTKGKSTFFKSGNDSKNFSRGKRGGFGTKKSKKSQNRS